jgi:predicted metalloprotease with PDZ domain
MRLCTMRGPVRLAVAVAIAICPVAAQAWGGGASGPPSGRGEAGAERLLRSRLGAEFTPMLPEVAECLGLEHGSGVVIGDVDPGGPAAQAGLRPGDVVTGAGEEELLRGPRELSRVVRRQPRGEPLAMQVIRDGQPIDLEVTPRRAPAPARAPEGTAIGGGPRSRNEQQPIEVPRIGAAVVDAPGGGARVESVEPEFPSAILRPGDVILDIDGQRVTSAEDLANTASSAPEDVPLALRVRHDGRVVPMGIKLGGGGGAPAVGGGPASGASSSAPSTNAPSTGAAPNACPPAANAPAR